MKLFDFAGPLARLNDAYDTLKAAWAEASSSWDDSASRRFQKEHLDPLDPIMRRSQHAIEQLAEAVSQAERECSEARA
jgi:uncharacterized protein YukE